ncbi:hypothetical protein GCM10018779_32860 [Streptomyces griseocarneus]|nr:hypothetical protein GCM10018779_32860 [Streptomyces griseocarneus]
MWVMRVFSTERVIFGLRASSSPTSVLSVPGLGLMALSARETGVCCPDRPAGDHCPAEASGAFNLAHDVRCRAIK